MCTKNEKSDSDPGLKHRFTLSKFTHVQESRVEVHQPVFLRLAYRWQGSRMSYYTQEVHPKPPYPSFGWLQIYQSHKDFNSSSPDRTVPLRKKPLPPPSSVRRTSLVGPGSVEGSDSKSRRSINRSEVGASGIEIFNEVLVEVRLKDVEGSHSQYSGSWNSYRPTTSKDQQRPLCHFK